MGHIQVTAYPQWSVIRGEFTPSGLSNSVFAHWPAIRPHAKKSK
jgi:hypothetical protein